MNRKILYSYLSNLLVKQLYDVTLILLIASMITKNYFAAAPEDEPVNAPPPSLRFVDQEENNKIHSDLQVTPGYQKHVAKKLSKLLDRYLFPFPFYPYTW